MKMLLTVLQQVVYSLGLGAAVGVMLIIIWWLAGIITTKLYRWKDEK